MDLDQARKRFLAAAALFCVWVLALAVLAAESARLPRVRNAEVGLRNSKPAGWGVEIRTM